jgi:hypothetical protein
MGNIIYINKGLNRAERRLLIKKTKKQLKNLSLESRRKIERIIKTINKKFISLNKTEDTDEKKSQYITIKRKEKIIKKIKKENNKKQNKLTSTFGKMMSKRNTPYIK